MSSIESVKRWNELAYVDYYIHFIKQWIPFNAWYVVTYGDTQDRACLEQIKKDSQVKQIIMDLLRVDNVSIESLSLKNAFTEIILYLKNNSFPTYLHRLDITEFCVGDNERFIFSESSLGCDFVAERFQKGNAANKRRGRIEIKVSDSANAIIYSFGQDLYDFVEFRNDLDSYSNLSDELKVQIKESFVKVSPRIIVNLVADHTIGLEIANGVFVLNDPDLLARAIVALLYQFRCKIFHGEVTPTGDVHRLYDAAYRILSVIVKKLI